MSETLLNSALAVLIVYLITLCARALKPPGDS